MEISMTDINLKIFQSIKSVVLGTFVNVTVFTDLIAKTVLTVQLRPARLPTLINVFYAFLLPVCCHVRKNITETMFQNYRFPV